VYRIEVQTTFSAAHALVIQGAREPVHGHDWRVTVTLSGPELDPDGLLCDFHAVEKSLTEITGPFNNANLNETPPFDRLNPSAELIAQYIATELRKRLDDSPAIVESVAITEAPGCRAIFCP